VKRKELLVNLKLEEALLADELMHNIVGVSNNDKLSVVNIICV